MTAARNTLLFAALLSLVALAPACTPVADELCEAKMDCEGGTETDTETCIIQADADEDIADEKGCIDLYDEALECFSESGSCREETYQPGDDCNDLFERLGQCIGDREHL